jgi:hypothetical protein
MIWPYSLQGRKVLIIKYKLNQKVSNLKKNFQSSEINGLSCIEITYFVSFFNSNAVFQIQSKYK